MGASYARTVHRQGAIPVVEVGIPRGSPTGPMPARGLDPDELRELCAF